MWFSPSDPRHATSQGKSDDDTPLPHGYIGHLSVLSSRLSYNHRQTKFESGGAALPPLYRFTQPSNKPKHLPAARLRVKALSTKMSESFILMIILCTSICCLCCERRVEVSSHLSHVLLTSQVRRYSQPNTAIVPLYYRRWLTQ